MVTVESIDALVDEYLRVIVRTRPWTRRREEESLSLLVAWAASKSGGREADTESGENALVDRCGTDLGLDPAERERLRLAVRNLNRWACANRI